MEAKLEKILLDLNIGKISVKAAKRKIIKLMQQNIIIYRPNE
jgi:hypothetical protein